MGFNAREYRPEESANGKLDLSYSGRVSQEEAEKACRYLPDMQARLDDAVAKAGRSATIRLRPSTEPLFISA